jgi:4-hydroxyphenylpyruvate dioxygenase
MDLWALFYEKLFNFREIRYFDIQGKKTGLTSRAVDQPRAARSASRSTSPPDKGSQIQEYLDVYHGEGIQHIALSTRDIFRDRGGRCASGRCASSTRPTRTTSASTTACPITARTSSA